MDLERVIEHYTKNSSILLDLSGITIQSGPFERGDFEDISPKEIKHALAGIESAKKVMTCDNYAGLECAAFEFEGFYHKLQRLVNQMESNFGNTIGCATETQPLNREKIYEVLDGLGELADIATKKGDDLNLGQTPLRFHSLFKVVQYLSNELGLKHSSNSNGHSPSNTDENLFAAAWYCAMFSDKKPVIITGDNDLVNMFKIIPPILADKQFRLYNQRFLGAFSNRPELVFRSLQSDYKVLGFDYSDEIPVSGFTNVPSVVKRVYEFWKSFQISSEGPVEPRLVGFKHYKPIPVPHEQSVASIVPDA
jgi:hypothetical protein